MSEIVFEVRGLPAPGGSKRAFVVRSKHSGKLRAVVTDDCQRSKPWQALVSAAAAQAYQGEPLAGPLRLEVEFILPRPKYHHTKRGLRPTAPHYHTSAPDSTKLLRSTEDALKGIAWADDAQVAVQAVSKRYGTRPGAIVRITRLVENGQIADEPAGSLPLFDETRPLICGGRRARA